MSRTFSLIALFSLLFSAEFASADGFLQKLPKDGTRAVYTLNGKFKATAGPNGQMAEGKIDGSIQITSVGQATENNEPCRWIEIKVDMGVAMGDQPGPHKVIVYKLLIPEKFLVKGQSPLDHVVRAWSKEDQREATELKDPKNIELGPLPILLAGPMQDAKPLDKAEVDSKLGQKVPCEGVAGTVDYAMKDGKKMQCKMENRVHEQSPFGIVAATWTVEIKKENDSEGGMEWSIVLSDIGENAKSELPDQN
jgi:hypothetical protein